MLNLSTLKRIAGFAWLSITKSASHLYALAIVYVIYNWTPSGNSVTSDIFVFYMYKAGISFLSIFLLFEFVKNKRLMFSLSFLEFIAISANLLLLFTQFSRDIPAALFELSLITKHNYKELPDYLYYMQLAIIGLSGICGILERNVNNITAYLAKLRGSNSDYFVAQGQ